MGIEKIFEEDVNRKDAVDEIRSVIRKSIDESAKQAINEKYKKEEVKEEEEEEDKSDEDKSDDDKEDDEDSEEEDEEDSKKEENLKEDEETAYDRFFNKTLKLWKVDSPDELSGEEEKEFYDYIDKNWDADNEEEKKEESVEEDEDAINESMEVTASRVGGRKGQDTFTINRMSDLKKLGKSRQYDYFMVTKKNGDEVEYSVDPQGNIVEM